MSREPPSHADEPRSPPTGGRSGWLAAAVAAAVVLLIGGAFVLLSGDRPGGSPPAGDRTAAGAPRSSVPAAPVPPAPAPGPSAQATPPPVTRPVIGSPLLYVAYGELGRIVFSTWAGGTAPIRREMAISDFTPAFAVSPQGRLAWIGDGGLYVTSLGGTPRRITTLSGPRFPCASPVWSPDGTRLVFSYQSAGVWKIGEVRADGTGRRVLFGNRRLGCMPAWSAGGRYIASYRGTTEGVDVIDRWTHRIRRVPNLPLVNYVSSLSPDGSKVVVQVLRPSDPSGDGGGRGWFTPTVVDTRTGHHYRLPVTGRAIGAYFQPDGRLLVRIHGATRNSLVLLGRDPRTRLASVREPAAVHAWGFLGYGPRTPR